MWDIHFETWTDTAVAQGLNLRHPDFPDRAAARHRRSYHRLPSWCSVGPSGLIVNCPVASLDVNISG